MNPEFKKKTDAIEAALLELRAVLKTAREQEAHFTLEREEMSREQWRLNRQIATLRRAGEENTDVASENDLLRETITGIEERLHKTLRMTHDLASELRR